MAIVRCPICNTANDPAATAGYCDGCGKKMPLAPLKLGEGRGYASRAYQQAAERRRHAKGMAEVVLFAVAVLQLVVGLAAIGLLASAAVQSRAPLGGGRLMAIGLIFAEGGVFAALGGWARSRPLPASVVGLGLYALLTLTTSVAAAPGLHLWIGLAVQGVVIAALVGAVVVSAKARHLSL